MTDAKQSAAPPQIRLGYCTNVHAGTDLATAKSNLQRFSVPIREAMIAAGSMTNSDDLGVGLWLAEPAASELIQPGGAESLRAWLNQHHLMPYTFNGFPQGDFHQSVVKHRVYRPEWFYESRRDYTLKLAEVLDRILPAGEVGSISTLPIAWGTPRPSEEQLERAARNLIQVAEDLERRFQATGRKIVLAIEPEPGCFIDTVDDMIDFFQRYIDGSPFASQFTRQYLTVCHDVCHSAVMCESQREVLSRYREAGIGIGKVQVSSALVVDWDALSPEQRSEAVVRLRLFAEDRYLHQTGVRSADGSLMQSIEDLPEALDSIHDPHALFGRWHIHFHVPIHVDSITPLSTTQYDIAPVVHALAEPETAPWFTGHYEIETYAWSVLPSGVANPDLSQGIAQEFNWFIQQFLR